MSLTVGASARKVIIEGLPKVEDVEQDGWDATLDDSSGLYALTMTLPEDELVWDGLWERIRVDYGFGLPGTLLHGQTGYKQGIPVYAVKKYDEVLVVADDQASTLTTIRISDTLISHTNKHHVPPLELHAFTSQREVRDNGDFGVSFERTTRIPDDNKLHHLPASLGRFELFSVDEYSEHLPKNVTNVGGVFFPMWQREAMWLNFEQGFQKYAVRVFVGRVNAITGQEMQKGSDTPAEDRAQDYIVIPGQRWLDGICVAPGIVRQFVAMPLGSGYTVEGQKSSKEKHGGLQLEVTPEMTQGQRFWSYGKHQYIRYPANAYPISNDLDEWQTPRELGCKIGDTLKSYPTEPAYREPFRIRDLFVSDAEESGETIVCRGDDTLSTPSITLKVSDNRFAKKAAGISMASRLEHDGRPSSEDSSTGVGSDGISEIYGTEYPEIPVEAVRDAELSDSTPSFGAAKITVTNVSHKTFCVSYPKPNGAPGPSKSQAGGKKDEPDPMELTEVQAKNIKTLGLAAGGKLIQDVYKDPYPATRWNHAAARILHVHMVDPESCEKVTHVVPQPPSMAVDEYVKSGGEFFVVEEKVDERVDGGDFDNVKSVSQMDKHVGITTEPDFDPTKPKLCTTCEKRLCDCIIRPCNHQFCNVCIKTLEQSSSTGLSTQQGSCWKCPRCNSPVSHVAGFSAPMNLPGEERLLRTKVPVHVLKIEDGRARFSGTQTARV